MTDENAPTCARCDRPMRHDTALICAPCAGHARRQLELVARIAGDITLTVARLARVTRGGTSRTDDLGWWKNPEALEPMPLPVDLDAAQRHDAAVNVLDTWQRAVEAERGFAALVPAERRIGRHPLAVIADCLAHNLEWLRHHPAADEAFKEIENACKAIERVVDRAPERIVVGRCPCGTWLYALAGAGTVTCEGCGTGYDVEASRQQLRDDLEDRLMTGAQIATMAVHLGIVDKRDRVRKTMLEWARRGRVVAHGNIEGEPTYRFGDVLGLLINAYARVA